MIDGRCISLFVFASFLKMHWRVGFTRNEEAIRRVNKIFSHFFADRCCCFCSHDLPSNRRPTPKAEPKICCLLPEKFPITTKINISFSSTISSMILALRAQEHSSLIPEKSLLRCNVNTKTWRNFFPSRIVFGWKQKMKFPRQRHNVFHVFEMLSRRWFLCLKYHYPGLPDSQDVNTEFKALEVETKWKVFISSYTKQFLNCNSARRN